MKKSNVLTILFYILLLAIFLVYIWLRVGNSQFIREPRSSFGDTHEFLNAAAVPLLSKSFWISLRPPVVPLFYKLIGGEHTAIFQFQLWFSILCWGALGLAVLSSIRSRIVKITAFLFILAFSLSEEIIMWDYIILGDSISISIMALFFASIVFLLSKWTPPRIVFLLISALLFTFVRDDFAYYTLMLGAITLLLLLCTKFWRRVISISLFLLCCFL